MKQRQEALKMQLRDSKQAFSALQSRCAGYASAQLQTSLNTLGKQISELENQLAGLPEELTHLEAAERELSKLDLASKQLKEGLTIEMQRHDTLIHELQVQKDLFAQMKAIHSRYKELKTEKVVPSARIAEVISPEELKYNDMFKDAIESRCIESYDKILSRLTDVNIQDSEGRTPLMHAITKYFWYGVDKLLQRGADVNLCDNQGANALIYAAQAPHVKFTKLIADRTADVNLKVGSFGRGTALHALLLENNKTVFGSELNGELHDATIQGMFVYADEDCTFQNTSFTSLHGPKATITFLGCVTIGSEDVISDTHTSALNKRALAIIDYLITRGADINAQDSQGLTPFFISCVTQRAYLAHELLTRYATNLTVKDTHGNTILYYAAKLPDGAAVVKVLLSKGVADLPNKYGRSVFDLEIDSDSPNKELVEALLPKKPLIPKVVGLLQTLGITQIPMPEKQANNPSVNKFFAEIASKDFSKVQTVSDLRGIQYAASALDGDGLSQKTVSPLPFITNTGLTPFQVICALARTVTSSTSKQALIECAKTIFSKEAAGSTLDSVDNNGSTDFMWAAWSGDIGLIKHCADIINRQGQSDLLLQPGQGQHGRDALNVSLELGYSPDVIKSVLNAMLLADLGYTLNKCATNTKLMPYVPMLLEKGADPNTTVPEVVNLTIFNGLCKHVFELKMQVANAPTPDAKLAATKCLVEQLPPIREVINSLAHHTKFDVNLKDDTGYSQGMWSMEVADPLLLEFLVREKGFNANAFDVGHLTPLHHQGNYRCLPMVKALLKQHASVNSEGPDGVDPVQFAILGPSKMHPGKLKPIIDAFLVPEIKPPYNPLHKMNYQGQFITAEELINSLLPTTEPQYCSDLAMSKEALHTYAEHYHPVVAPTMLMGDGAAVCDSS